MDTDNNTLSFSQPVVKNMLSKNKFYLPKDLDYSAEQRVVAIASLAQELHCITSNNYDDVVVEIDYSDAFCLLYEISFLHVKILNMKKVINEMQDKMLVSQTNEKTYQKNLNEFTDKYTALLAKYEELAEAKDVASVAQNSVEEQEPKHIVESLIKDVFYKAGSHFSEYIESSSIYVDDVDQNPF
jgi:hypothetical protein